MLNEMEKRTYIKPGAKLQNLALEHVMIGASPGVGGPFDPGKEIESKGYDAFDEEEEDGMSQEDRLPYVGF